MAYLTVTGLKKSFGAREVIHGVSFSVQDGAFLSLLGPSGCGKTTILRMISGLERPDSGSILVGESDITALPPEKRNIGLVFQNYALFPSMNVAKNVAYGLKMRKVPQKEIDERVTEALHLVRLDGYGERRIGQLSGGEQQRVALARALVIEPSILLLDEPLSALDRKIRVEMQYEIRTIQQKIGITTIFVTHDQEEALTMSDQIILMSRGQIEQHADPWTLYNHPVSVFASDFLGKANLLDAVLSSGPDGWAAAGAGWRLPVRHSGGADGEAIKVALRGEHVQIAAERQEGWSPFLLQRKIFTGAICKLIGRLGEDSVELSTMSREAEHYREGDTLYLSVAPEHVLYFH